MHNIQQERHFIINDLRDSLPRQNGGCAQIRAGQLVDVARNHLPLRPPIHFSLIHFLWR